jgi:hypothetical protein
MSSESLDYTLEWKQVPLGRVSQIVYEFPWFSATFAPDPQAACFHDFFAFMVDEDAQSQDPPFDAELLDEENWWLVDAQGRRTAISVPAVRVDKGDIAWRKR